MAPAFSGMPENACWFNCLGEISSNHHLIGDSFLKNGSVQQLFEGESAYLHSSVSLFNRDFKHDVPLLYYQAHLFMVCQQKFTTVFLHGTKMDFSSFGLKDDHYRCLRREICEFMHYISAYLAGPWNNETLWIYKSTIPDITNNLMTLWLCFKTLPDMPLSVLYSNSNKGNMCTRPSYHLMHLQLDIQWYRLTVLYRLERIMELSGLENSLSSASEDLLKFIESLLSNLFTMAVKHFEKVTVSVIGKSPFSCSCIKELWVLVQIFIDRCHKIKHQNDFWMYINLLLVKLLESTGNTGSSIQCSNPVVFTMWLLFHLSDLYNYTEFGKYEGPSGTRMVSNYPLLERVLKKLVSAEGSSEAQLRTCLPFVTRLVTELWPLQRMPVLTLWEHFHHRLNSCFFLQGATPDSLAISCASGAILLQQVCSIVDLPKSGYKPETSFQLFLRFLGLLLRKSPSQWPNIKGRIFSKFSAMRMQALKEIGIYNLSSLFLTMAWVGNVEEVGQKLQELLSLITCSSVDVSRRQMVWKAHLALLKLYIQKGMDISKVSKPLLDDVLPMSQVKEHDVDHLFGIFIRGVQDIINSSETLHFSEYTLLGNWIRCYLATASDDGLLLQVLHEIMSKVLLISKEHGLVEYNASDSHLTKMYRAFCEHLLPYIKGKFANSDNCNNVNRIADLAVNITLLALNRANVGVNTMPFTHFFESFAVNASPIKAKLSVKYVCSLLQNEDVCAELVETYTNYHTLIIQTWLRCSVYILDEDPGELHKLTNFVCRLPPLKALCEEAHLNLHSEAEPLVAFLRMLGHLFINKSSLQEKTAFREECTQYLTPMVKSFERMLRFKDISERTVLRIYQAAACIVVHCGCVIYLKTDPFCTFKKLISQLVLPVQIYKPGVAIHPHLLSALSQTLPTFIRGTVHLNKMNGNALTPTLKEIVERYFSCLAGRSKSGHPMLQCFFESEDKDVSRVVLEIITSKFLRPAQDSRVQNQPASLALMFLTELLRQKQVGEEIVGLVLDVSLSNILEVMIFSDVKVSVVKRQTTNLLKEILNNKLNKHVPLRDTFQLCILNFCRSYLLKSCTSVMGLLSKLCEWSPCTMRDVLPQIRQLVSSPMFTQRNDIARIVRNSLESMEKTQENLSGT